MAEVNSPSFVITFSDGTFEKFVKSKNITYHWTVGNSGVLMVFKDEMHAVFAIKLQQDQRILALNADQWSRVDTIDEVADDLKDEPEVQFEDKLIEELT